MNYSLQKAAWLDGIRQYRELYRREPAALAEVQALAKPQVDYNSMVQNMEVPEELRSLLQEKFQFRYDPAERNVQGILPPEDKQLEQTGIYRNEKEKS